MMVSSAEPIVKTVGLTKVFRDFWNRAKVTAVRDLDIEVAPGELYGLLGPNGSGKSTTIKMVLGLLRPTKGFIRIFDKSPGNVAVKQRIGFLPEESYLYPFLNARETLEYYGRLFRQPRRERQRRIDMLLDMVGLAAVSSRRVGEYSKGMQRRIGLAQALINDPDLLILDEPTSGMDPLGTRQFKDLILELGRRGKTVILCSHLLADVEDVCQRVTILYGGRKRAEGRIEDLLARQSLTQITAERLSEDALERIREIIASEGGKSILEVTHPRDKLETLFLRIVEQARAERLTTGGAVSTGEVAEFLRSTPVEGREVIEQLLKSEPAPAPAGDAGEAPPEPELESEVDQSLVAELTDAARAPEPEPTHETEARPKSQPNQKPAPPKTDQVDRGVLDGLLGDDRDDKENA